MIFCWLKCPLSYSGVIVSFMIQREAEQGRYWSPLHLPLPHLLHQLPNCSVAFFNVTITDEKRAELRLLLLFFNPTSEGMTRKVSTYIQSNSSSSSICVWILSSCKDRIKLGTPVLFCFTVYKILTLSHRSVSVGWRR